MHTIKIHCPRCNSEQFKASRAYIQDEKLLLLEGTCETCGVIRWQVDTGFPPYATDPRTAHAKDSRESKPL